jgi:hypothetical protein
MSGRLDNYEENTMESDFFDVEKYVEDEDRNGRGGEPLSFEPSDTDEQ